MKKFIILLLLLSQDVLIGQIQELDLSVPFPGGVHGLPRENICNRTEHPYGAYNFTNLTGSVADLVVVTYARVDDDLAIDGEIIEEGVYRRRGCDSNIVHEWSAGTILYKDVQPGQTLKLQVYDNVGWWVGSRGVIGFKPKCESCTSGSCEQQNGTTESTLDGDLASFSLDSKTNKFSHSLPKKLSAQTNISSPKHLKRFSLYLGDGQENVEDNIFSAEGYLYQSYNSGGLTQVDVINDNSYTIKQYNSSKVGKKNSQGRYPVTGSADTLITFSKTKFNELNIREEQGGLLVRKVVFTYNSSGDFWEMAQDVDGDGTIDRYQREQIKKSGSNTIKTSTVFNGSKRIVDRVRRTYDAENRLIQERVDPWGAELITNYTYTNGNLTRITYPDGSWETRTYTADNKVKLIQRSSDLFTKYEYNSRGLVSRKIESFNGSTYSSDNNQHKDTLYYYSPKYNGDDGSVEPDQPRLVRVRALGKDISRTYYAYLKGEKHVIQASTPSVGINNQNNLWSSTYTNDDDEVIKTVNPDGTGSLYTYSNNGSTKTVTRKTGVFNSSQTAIIQGTETVEVEKNDLLVSTHTFDIASGLLLSSREVTERDSAKREKRLDYHDGTYELFIYGCCNLDASRSREGIWTNYTHDSLGRQLTSTNNGVTTINTYDAMGRVIKTQEQGKNGRVRTLRRSAYDRAGRLSWTKDGRSKTTTYSYSYSNGKSSTTTTYPNGTKEINVTDSEGRLVSLSGNAVFPRGADLDEERVVYDGSLGYHVIVQRSGESSNWVDSFTDCLGRVFKTVSNEGATAKQYYAFGSGELIKSQSSTGAVSLYYRDPVNNIQIEALDVNNNGHIDYGTDTISRSQRDVVEENNIIWNRTRSWINPDSLNNPGPADNISKTSNDGLARVNTSITNGISSTFQMQAQVGNDGEITSTYTKPDGAYTLTKSVNTQQLFEKSYDKNGSLKHSVDYRYDNFNRLKSTKDSRNGFTNYRYNANDQVYKVITTDPDSSGPLKKQTFTNHYDSMGRRDWVSNPDGSKIYFEYTSQGLIKRSHGANVYPRHYNYDSKGQLKNIQTWKNYQNRSGRNEITWTYDAAGRLKSESDKTGKVTRYNYYPSGLLKEKIDPRGVKKSYLYDNSGRLKEVRYSDGTPSFKFTYNKWGQLNTVQDASGSSSYKYNGLGQFTGQKWTAGLLNGVETTYEYDSIGRQQKLIRKIAGQTRSAYYSYDSMGRMYKVSSKGYSFRYGYLYKAPQTISKMTVYKGSKTQMSSNRFFDKMMRTKSFTWKAGAQVLSSQNFTFDDLNRRDKMTLNDGTVWQYDYDSKGNLKLAEKDHGSDSQKDISFNYSFDDIGGRKTANENGVNTTYTSNDILQYTSIKRNGSTKNLSYDHAGNPLTYGDWDLGWDAESRLKSMRHKISGKKLEFGYNYRGFRIWKKVYNNGSSLSKWIGFVYDGNLVTEEIDLRNNKKIIRSYTWGLDPAGTQQQVGGIGALLSVEQNGKNYHVVSDAGGNVTKLYESKSDGSLVLANTYEYGPFGQAIAKTGNVEMPYQFNTKYTDEETGLVYYGYRFYNTQDGRWLNRDPIGVNGGINLYNSVSNNMVNGYSGGMNYSGGMEKYVGFQIASQRLDGWGLLTIKTTNQTYKLGDPFYVDVVDGVNGNKYEYQIKGGWFNSEKFYANWTTVSKCEKKKFLTWARVGGNIEIRVKEGNNISNVLKLKVNFPTLAEMYSNRTIQARMAKSEKETVSLGQRREQGFWIYMNTGDKPGICNCLVGYTVGKEVYGKIYKDGQKASLDGFFNEYYADRKNGNHAAIYTIGWFHTHPASKSDMNSSSLGFSNADRQISLSYKVPGMLIDYKSVGKEKRVTLPVGYTWEERREGKLPFGSRN